MIQRKYALVLPVIFVLMSCHKINENQIEYSYGFANTTNKEVIVDIYGSAEDYNNNQNRISQTTIQPGATQNIKLTALKDYWIDWYSNDYAYNNWVYVINNSGFVSTPIVKYSAPKINDVLRISNGSNTHDTTRSVLLPNGSSSSRWRAVQEFTNGGTTPGGPAPYMEFVFKKDFSCDWSQKNTSGNIITTKASFTIYRPGSGYPTFGINLILDGQTNINSSINFNPYSSSPQTTRDTLIGSFYENSSGYKYYSIVRQ